MNETCKQLCQQLLAIESPTFHEQKITDFILSFLNKYTQPHKIVEKGQSFIASYGDDSTKKTIALVGHSDVVPDYFSPRVEDGCLHGAGASDMKCSLGVYLYLLSTHQQTLLDRYNVLFICYAKEEGTAINQNGLNELIQAFPIELKQIDCAIIGEPTNNAIQLGCVGSLHATLKVVGEAAHSARPWNGVNALYKSLPLIESISTFQPQKNKLFGVDFYDVIQVTESYSEPGRTTIPGWWEANINYRFSPNKSEKEAFDFLKSLINYQNIENVSLELKDSVFAGSVITTPFFKQVIKELDVKKEAKQAWTDVAQLTKLGIPAFNFGPGCQIQAHKPDEYITLSELDHYVELLKKLFHI